MRRHTANKRTIIPRRDLERETMRPSEVVTRKMTSEEYEKYWGGTDMEELTKEVYLQRRMAGETRTGIMRSVKISQPTFYKRLREWGIETMAEEKAVIEKMELESKRDESTGKQEEQVPVLEQLVGEGLVERSIIKPAEEVVEASGADPVDWVSQPPHYKVGGIETIDYIEAKLTDEQLVGYFVGNVLKYCSRHNQKGGVEDLRKAHWYLTRLIEREQAAKK